MAAFVTTLGSWEALRALIQFTEISLGVHKILLY